MEYGIRNNNNKIKLLEIFDVAFYVYLYHLFELLLFIFFK